MSKSGGGWGDVEPPSPRICFEDRAAVEDLLLRHWACVDRIIDSPVVDLFCDDGEMHIAHLVKCGHQEIADYYRVRRSQEDESGRKTRHVITNLTMALSTPSEIAFSFIASVFSGVGEFPLQAGPPSTIADFSGLCRRSTAGEWLIAQLSASVTFVGTGAPTFAKKDQAE